MIVQYKTVKVDGVNIFFRQAENMKKPTVLLLHGFPSSSHMFRNLIMLISASIRIQFLKSNSLENVVKQYLYEN